MIRTLTVPPDRWSSFLRMLDRQLADRPIFIEVMGRSLGDQQMATRSPFRGIDYDEKGSERGSLTITVGTDRGEVSHRIIGPTRMYVALTDAGEVEWVAIEERGERGDAQTLVHFERLPALEAEYLEGHQPAD
jgi:hypothetical protein